MKGWFIIGVVVLALCSCHSIHPQKTYIHIVASCPPQVFEQLFIDTTDSLVISPSEAEIPIGMHTNTLLFSPLTMSWDVVDKLLVELDDAGFKFQADFFGKYNHAYRDNHIGVYFVEGCESNMSKQALTALR
ncbi:MULTISPECIES: hypothetical protein [Pseudoalteromonas]|uniref:hypothetical protein n=1 Tax=Pseudoalteromonas TaxID=53246 RepID=UPI00036C651E|nr:MULTISPECIES: hypothetical protein [Pseudoalteromonas]MDP4490126.1 hypothetical protein [Pseudoalteromonas piscicida]